MWEGEFMPITVPHQKELLSQAYVRAVVAKAGFNLSKDEFDYGYDGTIKEVEVRNGRYRDTNLVVNYQLKSTCNIEIENDDVVYDLDKDNYNDLIEVNTMNPQILILVALPSNPDEWLDISPERMIIKRCAWWCSLRGLKETNNSSKKRIRIPAKQLFTPEALIEIFKKVNGGRSL